MIPVPCTFVDGDLGGDDISGFSETDVGTTDNERKCADLVLATKPYATGATWKKSDGKCYAEYSTGQISPSTTYRTCFFKGQYDNPVGRVRLLNRYLYSIIKDNN